MRTDTISIGRLDQSKKGVIPAKAGIQDNSKHIDSCFRRNDKEWQIFIHLIF